jgi:hypothetical protein
VPHPRYGIIRRSEIVAQSPIRNRQCHRQSAIDDAIANQQSTMQSPISSRQCNPQSTIGNPQ